MAGGEGPSPVKFTRQGRPIPDRACPVGRGRWSKNAANAWEGATVEAVEVDAVRALTDAVAILSLGPRRASWPTAMKRIYTATGRLPADKRLLTKRPFRTPHHTIGDAGMAGGGNPPAPGEISLAHHGALFLDELPEFQRRSLEVLRQPLEQGQIAIARAPQFPARRIGDFLPHFA